MGTGSGSSGESPGHLTTSPVPVPIRSETRNLVLFAACTGMIYLAAPVLYVGVTQASLCDVLGASPQISNLPATAFFAMTVIPVLIAWYWPFVYCLKRNLAVCYLTVALMLGVVAVVLVSDLSPAIKIGVIIIQGGVSGAAGPTAIALLWEAIGRGSSEQRRGLALSLAFGAGPILAVAGSLWSQLLLEGNMGPIHVSLVFPYNFAALFAGGVPVMLLAAAFSLGFRIPPPQSEPLRAPLWSVADLIFGLVSQMAALAFLFLGYAWFGYFFAALAVLAYVFHFRDVLVSRLLVTATIVTILVYTGNTIPSNLNLYTREVLGADPADFAGWQNTIRFSFKVVAGSLLGWMLTRTNPKAGILVTSTIFVAALAWAMVATGRWYLVAFGIYGAGELVGVYAPNYILSASSQRNMRRNMAFMTMLMAPAAPFGYLYGWIADRTGASFGMANGFRLSFAVCAVTMLVGILIALVALPARPRPEAEHLTDA